MTPQQPLGVREVPPAAARRPVGKCLRQKQIATAFQFLPDRLPVLRRRFHYRFAHALFPEPIVHRSQLLGGGPELALLELKLSLPRRIARYVPSVRPQSTQPVEHAMG